MRSVLLALFLCLPSAARAQTPTPPSTTPAARAIRINGVFVNGRELHPTDVQGLTSLLGQAPWPGQWWVDGQGNYGQPGQPAMGNLVAIARQRQATDAVYRSDVTTGSSVYVGSGCTSVSGRLSSSDSSSSYSYSVGCE